MNYEHIDPAIKKNPGSSVTFAMNLDPNAKNYSNCDINGSFYEATEAKPNVASVEKKVTVDISDAKPPK
jgi:hypothetical protein